MYSKASTSFQKATSRIAIAVKEREPVLRKQTTTTLKNMCQKSVREKCGQLLAYPGLNLKDKYQYRKASSLKKRNKFREYGICMCRIGVSFSHGEK